MNERAWLAFTGVGIALIASGWLMPGSEAGLEVVRPLCIAGGVLLVAAAQFKMMRLPTDEINRKE